jgi:large subunit ribosomal protein L25
MERMSISVEKREEVGKGAARSLRRKNMIPAVLYRAGDSLPVKFSQKDISQFINSTAGEQIMVNLQFGDGSSRFALMKDYQTDPANGELLHADFFEVSLTEEVEVTVHVTLVGEPIGVRRDGGILQYLLREIDVECLPDKIPGHIEVDISNLEIGQSIRVGDLKLGEGITVLNEPDQVIINVVAPVVEEAAPVEVAAPEIKEPEVIKKGKKEVEEEEKKEKGEAS